MVNLRYWDKHKVASIITVVLLIMLYLLSNSLVSLDNAASEEAAERLSSNEAQTILEFYEDYEEKLDSSYYTIDSIHTIIWWLLVIFAIYTGLSALYIPERYQKKEEETLTP